MTPQLFSQLLSFAVSIFVVIAFIILFSFKKSNRIYYFLMIITWLIGVIYYSLVFFPILGMDLKEASAIVRFVQYISLGAWPILDAFELIFVKIKLRSKLKKIKSEKEDTKYG